MYDKKFFAVRGADWAESVEIIDADTNLALDVSAFSFELGVQDECDNTVLSASTAASTITMPATNIIAWRFTGAQISGLEQRKTYRVGVRFTDENDNITQLLIGSLAIIDGEIS